MDLMAFPNSTRYYTFHLSTMLKFFNDYSTLTSILIIMIQINSILNQKLINSKFYELDRY